MPGRFGEPDCPNSHVYSRMPDQEPCPRSDVYRMFENGTAQSIFGWTFRCRTCGTIFFRASRAAGMEGIKAGRNEQLRKQANGR